MLRCLADQRNVADRTRVTVFHPWQQPMETFGPQMVEGFRRFLDQYGIGFEGSTVIDGSGASDAVAAYRMSKRALLDNKPGVTLSDVASRPVLTVTADESLGQAVHQMGTRDIGRLPVVARGDRRISIGLLRRSDVVRAYSHAVLDRIEVQANRLILRTGLQGARVVEIPVPPASVRACRTITELGLASVKRPAAGLT